MSEKRDLWVPLALAAAMENRGQIQATDSDRARLAPIFDRLKRAGTRNVQVRPAGVPLDDLEGRMDAVLIDAPCTGTGSLRRHPDARWRIGETSLAELVAIQRDLLRRATRVLCVGSRIIYATCSLLREENEDQVDACLAEDPSLEVVRPREILGREAAEPFETPDQRFLVSLPHRHDTDGFFAAVLRRRAPVTA